MGETKDLGETLTEEAERLDKVGDSCSTNSVRNHAACEDQQEAGEPAVVFLAQTSDPSFDACDEVTPSRWRLYIFNLRTWLRYTSMGCRAASIACHGEL